MPYANVNGIKIYYEVYGKSAGLPILLINGLGGTCNDWGPLPKILSKNKKVIVYDNRGAGRTDKPNPPYSMDMLVRDALGLLDCLEIRSCTVVGISMGGMIAQHLALKYPDRIRKLVLGCTTCNLAALVCRSPQVLSELVSWMQPFPQGQDKRKTMIEKCLSFLFSPSFPTKHPKEFMEFVSNASQTTQPIEGFVGQLAAVMEHNLCSQLSEIVSPTLVLHGTEDKLIPLEEGVKVAERIDRAQLITLEDSGHLFFLEHPHQVVGLLNRFVPGQGDSLDDC